MFSQKVWPSSTSVSDHSFIRTPRSNMNKNKYKPIMERICIKNFWCSCVFTDVQEMSSVLNKCTNIVTIFLTAVMFTCLNNTIFGILHSLFNILCLIYKSTRMNWEPLHNYAVKLRFLINHFLRLVLILILDQSGISIWHLLVTKWYKKQAFTWIKNAYQC